MAALATVSCNESRKVMTPEAVVENFCRAVAAGDFDAARALCDTVSMNEYLNNYQKVADSLQKRDSCAHAIASSILAGAEFEVNGVEKSGNDRSVKYTLKTGESTKAKKAIVTKEEGEWKVKEITDNP